MSQFIEYLKTLAALHSVEGITQLLEHGGLIAVPAILFAETGLLVGFFLPGDSLLVTAGIFASSHLPGRTEPLFSLAILLPVAFLAAVTGDQVGYLLGRKTGPSIFRREDSFLFKRKNMLAAQNFYAKHGPRALILARFVPIFRTFVPFTAGVAQMRYAKFFTFSIIGGLLWTGALILVGYFLGKTPLADQLHKVILVIVVLSVLPILIGLIKKSKTEAKERSSVI